MQEKSTQLVVILISAGELNKEFANQIWDLYDFSKLEDEEKRFCVWMVPDGTGLFEDWSKECNEVLDAGV